jgi:hypothetical protein
VIETKAFLAAAEAAGMSEAVHAELVTLVALHPAHSAMPSGWGGARKLRFAKPGGGKSGGWRIVSGYCGAGTPVFLITVFGKGEKAKLSKAEANDLAKLVKRLCAA